MVDLAELNEIHQRLVLIKQSNKHHTVLFDGLDIVILLGDIRQLPPTLYGRNGPKPLWWEPYSESILTVMGKQL